MPDYKSVTSEEPASNADAIRAFIEGQEGEFTPSQVAAATLISDVTVRGTLRRLVQAGEIEQARYGRYRRAGGGDDSSVPGHSARIDVGDDVPTGNDLVLYPYAPHGHAGSWSGRSNNGMEGHEQIALSRLFLVTRIGRVPDPAKTYWTHVVGDSMLPWLRDGQMIAVEACEGVTADGRYALFLDDADEEIVKRVNRLGGRRLRLVADNPAYGSQEIQHVEEDQYRDVQRGHHLRLRVLGRVIEPPDDAQAIFATAIAAVRGLASGG